MEFVNAKIPITEEISFEKLQEILVGLGYKWPGRRFKLEKPWNARCLHTDKQGLIHYSAMDETCHDWHSHPGTPSKIVDGQIVSINEE